MIDPTLYYQDNSDSWWERLNREPVHKTPTILKIDHTESICVGELHGSNIYTNPRIVKDRIVICSGNRVVGEIKGDVK